MIIGIDIDGVLANQIDGVLPRIKDRLGISLDYRDITEFRLALGTSDLAHEIIEAMDDPAYLLDMPVHEGAHRFLETLRRKGHYVKLLTARPSSAASATRRWLETNALSFDEIAFVDEELKSAHGADILLDDYAGNVAEFLRATQGHAILLLQPWNQVAPELTPWRNSSRLSRAADLGEASIRIEALAAPLAEVGP